jgi:ABC-2 type transport system ATP-binding protein
MVPPAIRTQGLRKVYPHPRARRAAAGSLAAASGAPVDGAAPERSSASATTPNGIVALDALDLEVSAGEFFGLLGPNGAGKTTTLGILTTRVRPTAGQAWVGGTDVVRQDVAVRHLIGVVPQRPNPDRSLTVRENLVFHAAYFGIPKASAAARARELLDTFDLADRAESQVEKLSGGQQQRLMIARALMHDPEVIFLDEPTAGLDPQARLALWEILRELHAEGRTIILTTHYMEEADRLCERVAIVDRGRLLALDVPAALKAQAPGGTLIELTLDGDAAAAAEAVGASGVRVEAEGPVLRAWSPRAGEAVAGLIRAAEQAGRQVRDIHLAQPSLETLFISLTGRKLE